MSLIRVIHSNLHSFDHLDGKFPLDYSCICPQFDFMKTSQIFSINNKPGPSINEYLNDLNWVIIFLLTLINLQIFLKADVENFSAAEF